MSEPTKYCRAEHPYHPFVCTKPKGHEGQHEATGYSLAATWSDNEVVPTPPPLNNVQRIDQEIAMKSIILYGSPKKLTNAHKPVQTEPQVEYYVRMKVIDGDVDQAMRLAGAFIQPGEIFLNTVPQP